MDTEVGTFLDSLDFKNALQSASSNEGLDYNSLYLGEDSSGNCINLIGVYDMKQKTIFEQMYICCYNGDVR